MLNLSYNTTAESYWKIYQDLQPTQLNLLEKLWASWYLRVGNDILATGLLFFLTHEIIYFGRCLVWYGIDNMACFRKYKIQNTKLPSNEEQWECFKQVLKSHFMIEIIPIWLFHPLCINLKISISVPFPNWLTIFLQVSLFFVLEDCWHYWAHRLFHFGWFYKNIHKVHHKYAAPFGLAAEYAHPVEVATLGIGTVGFPILYAWLAREYSFLPELHLFTITLWISARLLQAVDAHSGYEFPWSLHHFLPFWAGAEHHDAHHNFFIGNYASSFRWFDYFLDTESGPYHRARREKLMKQKAEEKMQRKQKTL